MEKIIHIFVGSSSEDIIKGIFRLFYSVHVFQFTGKNQRDNIVCNNGREIC